jgi:hypothetical protein
MMTSFYMTGSSLKRRINSRYGHILCTLFRVTLFRSHVFLQTSLLYRGNFHGLDKSINLSIATEFRFIHCALSCSFEKSPCTVTNAKKTRFHFPYSFPSVLRQDNLVYIVTGIRSGQLRNWGSVSGRGKRFSLLHSVQASSWARSVSYPMGMRGLFPRL